MILASRTAGFCSVQAAIARTIPSRATSATNGLVCHMWRSEVLLLLVSWGLQAGVLTAIGPEGSPTDPG